jgi:hypothetical protein
MEGAGRCPEYFAHAFKVCPVSGDVDAFVFIVVFLEVGFNVDAPRGIRV